VAAQILRGDLPPETMLPPIRTMARELGISVITVKNAWEELQRQGFLYGHAGRGTFVAPHHPWEVADKRRDIAEDQMRHDLAFYRNLGLTEADVVALVQQEWNKPDN
jgi:GntR family transcriptional regulator